MAKINLADQITVTLSNARVVNWGTKLDRHFDSCKPRPTYTATVRMGRCKPSRVTVHASNGLDQAFDMAVGNGAGRTNNVFVAPWDWRWASGSDGSELLSEEHQQAIREGRGRAWAHGQR